MGYIRVKFGIEKEATALYINTPNTQLLPKKHRASHSIDYLSLIFSQLFQRRSQSTELKTSKKGQKKAKKGQKVHKLTLLIITQPSPWYTPPVVTPVVIGSTSG